MDSVTDTSEDVFTEELMKTKQKLKEISTLLDSQHMLLRLVVQVGRLRAQAAQASGAGIFLIVCVWLCLPPENGDQNGGRRRRRGGFVQGPKTNVRREQVDIASREKEAPFYWKKLQQVLVHVVVMEDHGEYKSYLYYTVIEV